MEDEIKKPQKKKIPRLTEDQKKKIYKEERKNRQVKYIEEVKERSTVVIGSFLIGLYILFSSLIISMGAVMYIVAIGKEEIKEAFASNPLGVTGDFALISVIGFSFWVTFGFFSLMLFIKSDEILKQKPGLYKKLNIWNWRKR